MRRRSDGREFWGSTSFRSCRNPETGDVMLFFRTTDITEKKLQEELLNQLAVLNYDVIMGFGTSPTALWTRRPKRSI